MLKEQYKFEYDNVRVLLTFDEDEQLFVAHALEFDLVGTGATEEEAKIDLLNTIQVQLEFAVEKSSPELILNEAPACFFKEWEDARKSHLLDVVAEVTKCSHQTSKSQSHALELPFRQLVPA